MKETIEQAEEGIASVVFRARIIGSPGSEGHERWIAIKSSSARKQFSPEPHDIVKEIALLSSLSHPNVRESPVLMTWISTNPWPSDRQVYRTAFGHSKSPFGALDGVDTIQS